MRRRNRWQTLSPLQQAILVSLAQAPHGPAGWAEDLRASPSVQRALGRTQNPRVVIARSLARLEDRGLVERQITQRGAYRRTVRVDLTFTARFLLELAPREGSAHSPP